MRNDGDAAGLPGDRARKPVMFALHALGMSGAEWDEVGQALAADFDLVTPDLAGFGENRSGQVSCREMAEAVARAVAARPRDGDAPTPWMIAGHSMGGRVAMIVAAMAEQGVPGLDGLTHVILVASSTPEPEPIDEAQRTKMLDWVADGAGLSQAEARSFVEANVAGALSSAAQRTALLSLAQADPLAWRHWLDRSSREDWSPMVGRLHTPALILAGAEDGPLGEAGQRAVNAPHFADASVGVIEGAAHLIPLEQPGALADAIRRFVTVERPLGAFPGATAALMVGTRVSARTRATHLARGAEVAMPEAIGPHAEALGALVAAVLPRHAETVPDLAARVGAGLLDGTTNGWRFADLPEAASAWPAGFKALDGLGKAPFAALSDAARQALLERVHAGKADGPAMDGQALSRWFEDMRARIVRPWLAHPATMARIGYDGFAQGGDGPRPQGYIETAADRTEPWQPLAGETA